MTPSRRIYLLGILLSVVGMMGITTNYGHARLEIWKYVWPFFIIGIGLLLAMLCVLNVSLQESQRKSGFIMGLFFFIYGIFFYITLLFNISWIFILLLLVVTFLGCSATLGGSKTQGSYQNREPGELSSGAEKTEKNLNYAMALIFKYRTREILIVPISILGLFSISYLTISYINETYGTFIYPSALLLTGLYLIKKTYSLRKYTIDKFNKNNNKSGNF